MIEVQVDQEFVVQVVFINENDQLVKVDLVYEWKPILRSKCKGMGHKQEK